MFLHSLVYTLFTKLYPISSYSACQHCLLSSLSCHVASSSTPPQQCEVVVTQKTDEEVINIHRFSSKNWMLSCLTFLFPKDEQCLWSSSALVREVPGLHLVSFLLDVPNMSQHLADLDPADHAMYITLPWTEMGQQKFYLISESHMSCNILSLYILQGEWRRAADSKATSSVTHLLLRSPGTLSPIIFFTSLHFFTPPSTLAPLTSSNNQQINLPLFDSHALLLLPSCMAYFWLLYSGSFSSYGGRWKRYNYSKASCWGNTPAFLNKCLFVPYFPCSPSLFMVNGYSLQMQ